MKVKSFLISFVFLFLVLANFQISLTHDKIEVLLVNNYSNFSEENFLKGVKKEIAELIDRRTKEFFGINWETKEFSGKRPYKIYPIYAYGIKDVAYYEVWLTKEGKRTEGWMLLSVTDKDYPLVNFSHDGTPYSQKVLNKASKLRIDLKPSYRIYRFGVSYFALEDSKGNMLADYGEMPTWLPLDIEIGGSGKGDSKSGIFEREEKKVELIEDIHFKLIDSYDKLKKHFPESYFTPRRAGLAKEMLMRIFPEKDHGEAYRKKRNPHYIYRWITDYWNQCLYTQIPANSSYNWANCWSGCNNNAWASLYGWWDKNMGKPNLIPTTSTGEGCPTYRNTGVRRVVVDPVQMWFRGTCSTYCSGGGGWTKWKNAWKGYKWTENQNYGYSYWYQWCNSAGCDVDLADILVDCIGNNYRPAHVGANSHFWVGTGLAQWTTNTDWTWVYCYPGWREDHNDDVWIWWHDLNSSTKVFVY